MNSPIASWIVTVLVLANAALAVGLVKHWTGATLAEILLLWDPRKPGPSRKHQLMTPYQQAASESAYDIREKDPERKAAVGSGFLRAIQSGDLSRNLKADLPGKYKDYGFRQEPRQHFRQKASRSRGKVYVN